MARVQKAGGGAVTPGRAPTGPAKKSTTGHAGATGAAGARGAATTKSRPAPVAGAARSGAATKGAAKSAPIVAAAPKAGAKGTPKGAPVPAKAGPKTMVPAAKVAAKSAAKTSPKTSATSAVAAAGAAKASPKRPTPAVTAAPKPTAKAAAVAKAAPAVKTAVAAPATKTAPAAAAVKTAPTPAAKAPARKEVPRRSGPLDKFLIEQRQLLFEERATHLRQAESLKEEADALAAEMEPGESEFGEEGGEGGNLSVERELDLVLSAQAKASVDEIDRALLKIEAGSYGLCEKCGKEIPKLRLKALPHAPLCVACKSGGLSRR